MTTKQTTTADKSFNAFQMLCAGSAVIVGAAIAYPIMSSGFPAAFVVRDPSGISRTYPSALDAAVIVSAY